MKAVLEIFSSDFSFCKQKGYYYYKCVYTIAINVSDHASGIGLPDRSKLAKIWKK